MQPNPVHLSFVRNFLTAHDARAMNYSCS